MNKSNNDKDSHNNNSSNDNILPSSIMLIKQCCVVRFSLYKARIDIWTIKKRKRAEFDHKYIFHKFWKYWIIQILAYSYLWSLLTPFYRLGLHQLISNLTGIAEQQKQENTSGTSEQQNKTKKYYQYKTLTYWADNITKFKTRKVFQ